MLVAIKGYQGASEGVRGVLETDRDSQYSGTEGV